MHEDGGTRLRDRGASGGLGPPGRPPTADSFDAELLAIVTEAAYVVDSAGAIRAWPRVAARQYGFSAAEAEGRSAHGLLAAGEDEAPWRAALQEAASTGDAFLETRRKKKDGGLLPVRVLLRRLGPIGGGPPVLGVVEQDLSEIQGLGERLLRELWTADEAKALLESATGIGLATTDAEGRIRLWSAGCERLFGYPANEAVGRNWLSFLQSLSDVQSDGLAATVRRALDQGRAEGEFDALSKDRGPLPVWVTVQRKGDAPREEEGFVAVFQDLTERRRTEELRVERDAARVAEKLRAEFLANMSHEIRTPLNAVIGMASLLADTSLTDEQRAYLRTVHTSAEHLLGLINDILDLSKIESGRMELDRQPFDLTGCLEEALELVALRASEKNLELAYEVDPPLAVMVVGDRQRVRQVLLNLLSNAVKFTTHGEVVLRVVPATVGANRTRIRATVQDTGIGIAPGQMNRLFQPFTQVDASPTRRFGGTGLGLAISKRLVERMGGEISIESVPDQGTSVHVSLEFENGPAAAAVGRELLADVSGKRVLIVDDNPTNVTILRHHALAWSMVPRSTTSPEEALQWVRLGEPFDVAWIDHQMPVVDGPMLCREIRARRTGARVPVLLLTSSGPPPPQAAEGGFDAVVPKPVRPSALFDALMGVLSAAAPRASVRVVPAPLAGFDQELASRHPLRILLAEDNPINQEVAVQLLKKFGYRPEVVGDGQAAMEALGHASYDLVFLDVQMPVLDGLEAARQMCQRWPSERRPWLVAMTAHAMAEDRRRCLDAGMDDYLSKPITPDRLRKLLESVPPLGQRPHGPSPGAAAAPDAGRQLLELVGGDRAAAEAIVRAFLAESGGLLRGLREAVAAQDAVRLERLAHQLKSAAKQLGGDRLSELCRRLEAMGRAGSARDAAPLLPELDELSERLRTDLRTSFPSAS